MDEPGRKRYYATAESEKALLLIKQRYSFTTDSDAIRFALLVVADKNSKIALSNIANTTKKKAGKR